MTEFTTLIEEIKLQTNETISKCLGEGIEKGFIKVRQSDPVLIREVYSDKIKLHHSIVIDYLGAEKIEELQKENEYLKKLNLDLHAGLSEFMAKAKPNTWLMKGEKQWNQP